MLKTIVLILGLGYASEAKNSENTKIVGGQKVEIQDAPFIVMLLVDDRPLCGASILSHNFFLTAAHCTHDMKANHLSIRSGSSHFGEGEKNLVSKIYVHPEYNAANFDNDFSLVKIFGRIMYNKNQMAIKLMDEDDEVTVGDMGRVLGWGNTENSEESSEDLRGVDLILISAEECEEAYKPYGVKVNPNKICASHPERIDGKDACQGIKRES